MSKPTRSQIAAAIVKLIERSHDTKKLAKAIASYLAENRATKELDAIMREVTRLRAERGVAEASVTSAFPLSNSLRRDIEALISKDTQAKTIVLNEVVEPSVLGGVRVETGETQLDATIQSSLHKLKRAIV
jgi:ATP synthase F1 delta subunit